MTKEQRTRQGVFWAVTIGYGLFYVCRLSLSVLKKGIIDDGFLTESELGIIGSALFFGYAVGKLFNGFLADHINVRYFMSAGLLICAIVNAVLALKVPFIVFVILWAINGWFQSVGAPCSIISLKRWFGNDGFGTKYGYWSLSHNLGEAITFYVTALIVGALGWQAGFLGAAGMGLIGVILIFALLRPFQSDGEKPASAKERLKEKTADGYALMAFYQWLDGNTTAGGAFSSKALKLENKHLGALETIGLCFAEKGSFWEAKIAAGAINEIEPGSPAVFRILAVCKDN